MRLGRAFIFACLLTPLAAASARACTCGGYPSPAEAFERAAAVFVGRVVRAAPATVKEAEDGEQTVVARVEESFKRARVGALYTFRQPAHNCAPKFEQGGRFLFHAGRDPKTKTWEVYGCGRSADLGHAADDLLYLRALPLSAQRNRVSGMLLHYEDGPGGGFKLVGGVAGAKVRVRGRGKTFEATTDSNGVYELYDLPPGKYTVEPEPPFGLRVSFPMPFGPGAERRENEVTVRLEEKTSAGADFILGPDNRIAGRAVAFAFPHCPLGKRGND